MGNHKEPWRIAEKRHGYDQLVRNVSNDPVAIVPIAGYTKKERKSIIERIVACVNACEGIPTEALEEGALLAQYEKLARSITNSEEEIKLFKTKIVDNKEIRQKFFAYTTKVGSSNFDAENPDTQEFLTWLKEETKAAQEYTGLFATTMSMESARNRGN